MTSVGDAHDDDQALTLAGLPDAARVAATLAAQGWPVIPIKSGTKGPAHQDKTGDNHEDAWCRSAREVVQVHEEHEEAGEPSPSWALMTGQPNGAGLALAILDNDGDPDALADLLAEAGPEAEEWGRSTVRVQRPNAPDRCHLLGTVPSDRVPPTRHVSERIEWRGATGYVLLPCSRHPSDVRYEITRGPTTLTGGETPKGPAIYKGIRDTDGGPQVEWAMPQPVPDTLLKVLSSRLGKAQKATTTPARPVSGGGGGDGASADGSAYARLVDRLGTPDRSDRVRCPGPNHKRGDRNPSLRLTEGTGRALLHCYAGCETEDIMQALDLTMPALHDDWTDPDEWDEFAPEFVDDREPDEEDAEGDDDDAGDEEEFWESREFLTRVRDTARARRVAPWALLGAVLARAAACVSPEAVLPPTRGSHASLNLFVALAGSTGAGKSTAISLAREFLVPLGGEPYEETAPGSGEGLVGAFCYVTKAGKGEPPQVRQSAVSLLLDVDEAEGLARLVDRSGSTLRSTLKSAWSGRTLATLNASADRRRKVGEHRYRLCITVGAQPTNAGALLDDIDGGFPARFLWVSTYDPRPGSDASGIDPWEWTVPVGEVKRDKDGDLKWSGRRKIVLPKVARDAMLAEADRANRPIDAKVSDEDRMHGQALLMQAKVAALLAMLDDRTGQPDGWRHVTVEDWTLAGTVMGHSHGTRRQVQKVVARAARADADQKARRAGRSASISEDARAEMSVVRLMASLRRKLGAGELPEGDLLKVARSDKRAEARDALDRLVASGEVIREERENSQGRATVYYRLAE